MKEYSRNETVYTMECNPFAYISLNYLHASSLRNTQPLMSLIALQNDLEMGVVGNNIVGTLRAIKQCRNILEESVMYN